MAHYYKQHLIFIKMNLLSFLCYLNIIMVGGDYFGRNENLSLQKYGREPNAGLDA